MWLFVSATPYRHAAQVAANADAGRSPLILRPVKRPHSSFQLFILWEQFRWKHTKGSNLYIPCVTTWSQHSIDNYPIIKSTGCSFEHWGPRNITFKVVETQNFIHLWTYLSGFVVCQNSHLEGVSSVSRWGGCNCFYSWAWFSFSG